MTFAEVLHGGCNAPTAGAGCVWGLKWLSFPKFRNIHSPFAQSTPHILNFKLPVEISTQP